MPTEGKGPIVIPCYLVGGVPYVLEVDANGKLAVRAVEIETLLGGGLPAALDGLSLKVKEQSPISGFATSANQATMITALQLIDDLRAALGSVNTDDLQVDVKTIPTVTVQATGSDKIFALESIVEDDVSNTSLPAGSSTILGNAVPTGKIWVITAISVFLGSTTINRYALAIFRPAEGTSLQDTTALNLSVWICLTINIFLKAGDFLALTVFNATLGDAAYLRSAGYQMDAP